MIIMSIELFGLENIPIVDGDSDISSIIKEAIEKQGCGLNHGDIILIAETLISTISKYLRRALRSFLNSATFL